MSDEYHEYPNIFILSADSLRYDYFSEAQESLSNITEAVSYTDAVAPATQTSSSMPALTTGHYVDEFETWGLPDSGERRPLAEVFQKFGYTAGLWSDNFLFGKKYNYDRGFNGGNFGEPTLKKKLSMMLQSGPIQPLFPHIQWAYFNIFKRVTGSLGTDENFYQSATKINKSALEWVSGQEPPVFAWIHYMDTHHPFEPPSSYIEAVEFNTPRSRSELSRLTREVIKSNGYGYSSEDIEDVRRGYEAACEYQADEIINLIKRLKEQGLYHPDRDIFVFTADHGECLSCEKYEMMGHVPPALWEEIIRVPLVISMPNWNQKKIHEQVSLVNVYNIIKTAVKARIDEDSSLDAPSPEQLTTDVAHFATEWEVPGENTIRRYRGVRTAEGAKLFGRRNDEDDTVVLTQYDKSSMLDEVQFESNKDSTPTDDDTAVLWRELINMVEERGPILGDVQAVNEKVNRKHLRDLGYIQ